MKKNRGKNKNNDIVEKAGGESLGQIMNRAIGWQREHKFKDAEQVYRQVLAIDAKNSDAHHLLGLVYFQSGRLAEAYDLIQEAIKLSPGRADYHINLGHVLKARKEAVLALAAYERAASINNNMPEAHFHLGQACAEDGQIERAESCYRKVLELSPNSAEAFNNIGSAFKSIGKAQAAIDYYRKAVEIKPDFAWAYNNLGTVYGDQKRYSEAKESLQTAIRLKPDYANAWNNLGVVLKDQGLLKEASEAYRKAIELDPLHANAYNNLGSALSGIGKYREAIECYRKFIEFAPNHAEGHSNLLFSMHYAPDISPEELKSEHETWCKIHAEPLSKEIRPHSNLPLPDRRLKIGIVSSDFRRHPVGYFLTPLFASYNKDALEIIGYYDRGIPDELTVKLKSFIDGWRDVNGMVDAQLAKMIRQDGIDILIDMSGHTAGNRLLVFARKPAPIQVTYLGYPDTTGLTTIDYIISDPLITPPGFEGLFTETVQRLEKGYICYQAPENIPEVSPLPALENGYITFGCFNNLAKVTPDMVVLWSRLLHRVKDSRLYLKNKFLNDKGVRDIYLSLFEAQGVGAERLTLAGSSRVQADHLAHYHKVDIGLDPFPYNGVTTTCETLYMGVPVISQYGNTFVSRQGFGILSRIGYGEWAVSSSEKLLDKAEQLSLELGPLAQIRAVLRQRVSASDLCDQQRFARDMEAALREIWHKWCKSAKESGRETANKKVQQAIQQQEAGQVEAARQVYDEILQQFPDHAEALHYRGATAFQQGDFNLAEEFMQRSIQLQPDNPVFRANLGAVYRDQGKYEAALTIFRGLRAQFPQVPEAHHQLGLTCLKSDALPEAVSHLTTALKMNPKSHKVLISLGLAHKGLLDYAKAEQCYQKAIQVHGDDFEVYSNLGVLYKDLGNFTKAAEYYQRALELNPGCRVTRSNRLMLMLYDSTVNHETLFQAHRQWDQIHGTGLERVTSYQLDSTAGKRLRIGYVSPDFRAHSCAWFLLPVICAHDKTKVEIFCYAESSGKEDWVTSQFKIAADNWRGTSGITDSALVRMILQDKIDILVDLAGHTAGNRLGVFTAKPAPVQITWLGYGTTSGLSAMDYKISDEYLTPAGTKERFTENLVNMPECFSVYQPPPSFPNLVPPPALRNGYITFGSFNNLSKCNVEVIYLWAQILLLVPGSRLILKSKQSHDGKSRQRIGELLVQQGVDASRLEIRAYAPDMTAHLSNYNDIDIGLDTFPYAGCTTTCEALWMGVPVITLSGERTVSRYGLSLLSAVGLKQFCAENPSDYINIARKLAQSVDELRRLRLGLREQMLNSALCQGKRFTSILEQVFRSLWERSRVVSGAVIGADQSPAATVPAPDTTAQFKSRLNQAVALHQSGDYEKARVLYEEILAVQPGHADALHLSGLIAFQTRNFEKARELLRQAIAVAPNHSAFYSNLGLTEDALGQTDAAIEAFEQALKLEPNRIDALNGLGLTLVKCGRVERAVEVLQQALQQDGRNFNVCRNLAHAFGAWGQLEESIRYYRLAAEIAPGSVDVLNHLGIALHNARRLDESVNAYQAALRINPQDIPSLNNLASVLKDRHQLDEAAAAYRRALASAPNHAGVLNNLGNVLNSMGKLEEAIECYRKVLSIDPQGAPFHSNLLMCLQCSGMSQTELRAEHDQWNSMHAAELAPQNYHYPHERSPDRRLRIGLTSNDFRRHPVGYFLLPLLEHYDRTQLEIICYSDRIKEDDLSEKLRSRTDGWKRIHSFSDLQLDQMIRQDRIDILMDMSGHTAGNRLLVFARKPAPVQVTWLAYPGGTGLKTIDYIIADQQVIPAGDELYYTETPLRLPDCYLCYSPPEEAPEVQPLPALQKGRITFGCFNNPSKLSRNVIDVWAKLLEAVPESVLMLKYKTFDTPSIRQSYTKLFAERGINSERLIFSGFTRKFAEHLAAYHEIDIGLDPFPYNGTTTTCETLYMGAPVISLRGNTFAGRQGVTIMNSIGLQEWIADDQQAYIQKAIDAAADLNKLAQLRMNLRETLKTSPLCDGKQFSQKMNSAFRKIWNNWLEH